ncbi:MAG: anhydro-N-acetylmuramic acid kinase [Gammaproteobacteria bacterium]|nr:anhydro-N-acetylmuramic acid kinase [Gammaproteobacteria bacterium]
MAELYIGLMSGTSMDGIDAALVDLTNDHFELLGTHSHPLPTELKFTLQQLTLDHPSVSIDMLGEADAELGELFAEAAIQLLEIHRYPASDIIAIGSHGQTIRHRPDLKHPFSLQIGDANRIAHRTGITTIADFRRKDMAAGGEGAPLAPAFHQAFFSSAHEARGVLNIGGIANITYLPSDPAQPCFGFDTGPGNMLMDSWIQKHQLEEYDRDGHWAASGKVHDMLVEQLMHDPYLQQAPPRSTGREHYNLKWLEQQLEQFNELNLEDVQASLCEFTALSIKHALEHYVPKIQQLIVCGGGVHNKHLMKQLQSLNPGVHVGSSEHFGLASDWVEAVAFAWLARQTLEGQAGNLPEVTGADEAVILGAIHPA